MEDDTLVRPSSRGASSIVEILNRAAALPPKLGQDLSHDSAGQTATDFSMEPAGFDAFDAESTDYKAYGRAGNRTLPSLRFILKDKSERACCYAHLDSHYPGGCEFIPSAPGTGNVIKLRFAGQAAVFMVIIEGRNLRRLWELIQGHLTPWVHVYPSDIDVEEKRAAVVKSITFTPEKGDA
jgi:hypothetical protein